jgi:hypothetical protein
MHEWFLRVKYSLRKVVKGYILLVHDDGRLLVKDLSVVGFFNDIST